MLPRYPLPWRLALSLLRDALRSGTRSFRTDSRTCTNLLSPPPKILNLENIPTRGPCLLVMNHYARPSFPAWWIALGISAAMPVEVHWMMTNAWRHLGPLEPFSRWLFPRLAHVYGFTPTPPMPPDPRDLEARARAVRRVLQVARSPEAMIGLAPEGRDHPEGILGPPPPGVGRFIHQLSRHCQRITPIGVYEDEDSICLDFGPVFELPPLPAESSANECDHLVSQQVMREIARQLPLQFRGMYGN
jgi:1-acyl-sn-glycerol-3-phosphate acyltransferase